jgi:opacity protein-like surface antigen
MALSSVNAGLYVGLATIGQALPFVTAGVATVMLTAVLDHPSGRSQYLRLTRQVVLGLSVIFLALMVCVPGVLVRWSLGEAYRAVVPLLAPYGIAMVCEAWAMVELTRSVADNELGSLLLGGLGTLAWIGGLSQAHTLAAGVEQTVLWMAATVLGLAVGRMWAQP